MRKNNLIIATLIFFLTLTGFALLPQAQAGIQQNLPRQVFQITNGAAVVATVKIEVSPVELRFVINRPNQAQHTFRQIFQTRTLTGEVGGQTIFAVDFNPNTPVVSGNPQQIQTAFLNDVVLLRGVREQSPLPRVVEAGYLTARAAFGTVEEIPGLPSTYAISQIENNIAILSDYTDCLAEADEAFRICLKDPMMTDKLKCVVLHAGLIISCNQNFVIPESGNTN